MSYQARVCIVGAGISGLVTAKVFLADGFQVDLFEKASDIGGVWHPGRTYPDLRTNDPRDAYCFSDYPYTDNADEFPTAEQVWQYLDSYARHFDLRSHIQFLTEVVSIGRAPGAASQPRFRVRTKRNDGPKRLQTHYYDYVVVCNGVFCEPNIPRIKGAEKFGDRIIHSSEFRTQEQVEEKRVIVLGGGKSAYDCASVATDHAKSCLMICRSPHWLAPRYILGFRADWLILTRLFQAFLPYHTMKGLTAVLHGPGQPLVRLFWRFQSWLVKRMLNMPPELVPEESFPKGFQNIGTGGKVYERLRSSHLSIRRGEIEQFVDEATVLTTSGERIQADLLIFATGWTQQLDFLEPALRHLVRNEGRFCLYRHILPPEEPNLGFVGYASSIGNTLTSEIAAHWLASHFQNMIDLPETEEMYEQIERVHDWATEMLPAASEGYLIGPYITHYIDELMRDMGLSAHQAGNFVEECFGRFHPRRFEGISEQRRQIQNAALDSKDV